MVERKGRKVCTGSVGTEGIGVMGGGECSLGTEGTGVMGGGTGVGTESMCVGTEGMGVVGGGTGVGTEANDVCVCVCVAHLRRLLRLHPCLPRICCILPCRHLRFRWLPLSPLRIRCLPRMCRILPCPLLRFRCRLHHAGVRNGCLGAEDKRAATSSTIFAKAEVASRLAVHRAAPAFRSTDDSTS